MNIIVAVNSDWGIGLGGTQTIVIPEDRRRFKTLTDGCTIISGRKTFEDFRKPLPNRKNIILTRDRDYRVDGAVIKHSVDDILSEISGDHAEKVFVIGGGSVYRLFLPLCALAYVTKIEAAPPSDTFFPNLDESLSWSVDLIEPSSDCHLSINASTTTPVRYSYVLYRNKEPVHV